MPYYVFKITPERELIAIASFASYREAKQSCQELRRAQASSDTSRVRMTFAETERDAKRLLAEKRTPSSPLEEWEA